MILEVPIFISQVRSDSAYIITATVGRLVGALNRIGGPNRPMPHGACAAWDVPASCCPLSGCISVTLHPRGGSPWKEQPPCLSPTARPGNL